MSNSHRHKHTKFRVPLLVGKGELTFVGFGGGGGRFDNHLTGADLALDSPEYSAAKAAVENLTRWLAVELAPHGVRVNAVAPGFFVSEQNRALLIDESGALTARGELIVAATPAGRFGEPHEVAGTVTWLCSAAASFVTGVVVPIDGGFNAFSGV